MDRGTKQILIIGILLIIFWLDVVKFINPKPKKKPEEDLTIDGNIVPDSERDDCKHIIYQPLSMVGLHSDATLPKGFCYVGDSYFSDKPHVTGDAYAGEQADAFEAFKNSEADLDLMDNVVITLQNTTDAEIDTEVGAVTTDSSAWGAKPDAPVASAASEILTEGFTANWSASARATGYYVDVATDSAFTSFVTGFQNKDAGDVTSLSVTGLVGDATYYYRVRAYNTTGTSTSSSTITTTTGVYSVWFLGSKDEVIEMYAALKAEGVGGFSDADYWTSSERNATTAYINNFTTGFESNSFKNAGGTRTRAVRTFSAAIGTYSLRDIGPGGGLIFYIDGTTYYEASESELSISAVWSNVTGTAVTGTGTAIGTGITNTTAIINQVGSNMIASWVNGGVSPYETFTSVGANITSAIEAGGGGTPSGNCLSDDVATGSGKAIKVTINLTLNSGEAPELVVFGHVVDFSVYPLVNGNNVINHTTGTGETHTQLIIRNYEASNWSAVCSSVYYHTGSAAKLCNDYSV